MRRVLVAICVLGLVGVAGVQPAAAAPADVVISELMYHPADAAPVEFLEITNRGGTPEDISGWCLATGIDFCFGAGTVIQPGQYLVVTDNLAGFSGVYGGAVNPVGEYAGGLSNGGETIDLMAGASVIDTVSYDDAGDWPGAPDGTGPSLELRDLFADNNLAENWLTSIDAAGHTVGRVNSVDGVVFPSIEEVTADPQRPNPGQAITVSARLADVGSATLTYKINWLADQNIAMDDGPASVGGAGDGVWSGVIPSQTAGDLVRYRVDVVSGGVSTGVPDPFDTIGYLGVVVVDSSVNSSLPVLEWFMEDSVHANLLANHRFDDVTGDAVMSYNGEVIDGVQMYIRGNSSRNEVKISWKVEFPNGYLFDMGGLLEEPVDEFNMQRSVFVHEELGWGTAALAGLVTLQQFKMRTQRNGEFYSVSTYAGTYDGRWRDNNGRDTWALYKAEKQRGRKLGSEQALIDSGDWDKKEGDNSDWSDLHELTTMLDAPATTAQRNWMWENLNIAQWINYAATISVLRHSDSSWYNYYVTNDTQGTGRWEMMLWDLDTMFREDAQDGDGDFVTPADNGQKFMIALMAHPEFKQMYFRRVRTLIDEHLQPTTYEDWATSIFDPYRADFNLDRGVWGGRTEARHFQVLFDGIAARRDDVAANLGADGSGKFPPSATGATPIEISQIEYAPAAGSDAEFVQLRNTSATESIDLTGWSLSGAATGGFVPGAVLVPGATAYVVANDNQFRAVNSPTHFVAGLLTSSLPDGGGTVALNSSTGAIVDTVNYPVGDPDPDPDPDPGDVQYFDLASSWVYFDQGPAEAAWSSLGFNDGAWPSGTGEFGFGDGDESTLLNSGELTSYFRKTFTVADPAQVSQLVVSLRLDDGGVVYINGVEVVRDNMAAGPVSHNTPAASTRYSDENAVRDFNVSRASLVTGTNVIAVEAHNRSLSSSDLSFDLALNGTIGGAPDPDPDPDPDPIPPPSSCTATISGTSILVTWDAPTASEVIIQRQVNGGTWWWRGKVDANTSPFTDSNRSGSIIYRVKARYPAGDSGYTLCSGG